MATQGPYSYALAKTVLSETDKDRFLCCYLNAVDTNAVDWSKASSDFGSASLASFKKMIGNAFKKIKEAEANGVQPADPTTSTPRKGKAAGAKGTPGSKGKRKAAAAGAGEDGDDEEGGSPSKKAKGKGGRGKGKKEVAAEDAGDDEEEAVTEAVKEEEKDDDDGLT